MDADLAVQAYCTKTDCAAAKYAAVELRLRHATISTALRPSRVEELGATHPTLEWVDALTWCREFGRGGPETVIFVGLCLWEKILHLPKKKFLTVCVPR